MTDTTETSDGVVTDGGFEASYAAGTPPWDVGRPQAAMAAASDDGRIEGRVLDAGCGTGSLALFLASCGHEVVGVDASPTAIERARTKAHERGIDATFAIGDLLDLPDLGTFDTVVDSGVLHVFDDAERDRYLASLAGVLRPGGWLLSLVWGEGAPGGGPRRYGEAELRGAFAGETWTVESVERTEFETTLDTPVPAYLVVARRV